MTLIIAKVIRSDFTKVANATKKDVAAALLVEAESIMTGAKKHYVPIITGALSRSGTVLAPVITDDNIKVTMGFGSDTVAYAAKVHELPNSAGQHKNKFLSKPLNVAVKGMGERLAKAVKRSIAQTVGSK